MEFGVALGSNLGDRLRNLQYAAAALQRSAVPGSEIEKSPVFATQPVDCQEGSEHFFNAAIIMEFGGSPGELLELTQRIELDAGRADVGSRSVNAPRVIDLDLLYAEGRTMNTQSLMLPHPRLHLRRFVLEPLVYVRRDLVISGQDCSVKELLASLQSQEPPLQWLTSDW